MTSLGISLGYLVAAFSSQEEKSQGVEAQWLGKTSKGSSLCAWSWCPKEHSGSSPEYLLLYKITMFMTLISVPSPRTFNIKTRKSIRFYWYPHSTMERNVKASVENIDWLHCRLRNWVYSLLQQSIFPPHSNLCSSLFFQISYLTSSNLSLLSRASNPASFQKVLHGESSTWSHQQPTRIV